jgi:hypothetical protein
VVAAQVVLALKMALLVVLVAVVVLLVEVLAQAVLELVGKEMLAGLQRLALKQLAVVEVLAQ